MKLKHLFLVSVILFLSLNSQAQMRYYTVKGGVQYNQTLLFAEFNDYRFSFLARGYFNVRFSKVLSGELGVGYGQLAGTDAEFNQNPQDWKTNIMPVDFRLRIAPFTKLCYTNPYLYFGGGVLRYDVTEKHSTATIDPVSEDGFAPLALTGFGLEIKLSQSVILDLSAGMTYTFTDDLNYFSINKYKDAYANFGIGLTFTGEPCNTDSDKDGLTKCVEEELGTNPDKEDTDGDGLRDGKEIIRTKTDPLKKDTDGDGLNDFEEVIIYETDPNVPNSELHK